MNKSNNPPIFLAGSSERYAMLASIYIEGGLALFAIVLGYFIDIPPGQTLKISLESVAIGILATIPMLAFYVVFSRLRYRPFVHIQRLVRTFVLFFFRECTTLQVALICALAGIGEELFFRGLLQGGLEKHIAGQSGMVIALLVSSIIFGLAHFVSKTYALIAFAIGIYLGLLFHWTDNILVPIITHAVYDYYVIKYLLRGLKKKRKQ